MREATEASAGGTPARYIQIRRVYPVSSEKLYAFWATGELRARWLPSSRVATKVPGTKAPQPSARERRLCFQWSRDRQTQIQLELRTIDAVHTELVLTHTGFQAEGACAESLLYWNACLAQLSDSLDRKRPS